MPANKYDNALNKLVEQDYTFKFEKYIADGFDLYKTFIGEFSAYYIIILLVSLITNFIPGVGYVFDIILYPVFTAGTLLVVNELIKKRKPDFNFFFKGFDYFVPPLLLTIVSTLVILFGLVLLIIPGIYLAISYSFANMLVIFCKYEYWDAMEWSRKIITKQWWSFFGFLIVIGLINVAGLLFCGVGIVFTAPATMCMLFCAFEDIVGNAIRSEQNLNSQNYYYSDTENI